ncbi:hypothetical protein LTR10_019647 [Elasticomyces elasticus]|uniref:Ornithine aminotransferase n=1 Tax=Exophiala sideris TaxID=1016849 RepID=A0ABR0JFJ5_9EURO|nr:hypothetical protein LTR10_019647 [Elasticomyces elasticus]KAK5025777.1 hypothetical protein LTS07_007981 [Exophiala sideris]KAK5033015.1 hypothetical protein LTR13_006980 [Exophiala sideris]KAK5063500.1 hypothetical protein LTR69_004206 [Exophiala sideris]KAK5180668.1 hypothetical protein LTR44_006982 [Eurotiomycetes sp. CCFEE 6388]
MPPSATLTQPPVTKVTIAGALTTDDYVELDDQYAAPALESIPVVLNKARGAHLWDIDGNKYIDFLSMFSVVNQGHCHPRIVSAMVEQCQKITVVSRAFHNEHFALLCKKLCHLLQFDQAFAMNSGSEATDLAIKLARKWGYKVKGIPPNEAMVVTLAGNYHGKTLGPLSASNNATIREGFGPFIPGVGPVVDGRTVRYNHIEDLEEAFRTSGHRIAGVMIECVQGYAGCVPAAEGYVKAMADLCRKNNALFIADEIQSGLGRAGYMMAYQKENVHPDMTILGKALTGGVYPMSMVLGAKEVMGLLQPGEHSSTFSGNPLASAVALAAVDVVIDEGLPERSLRLGNALKERLRTINSPYAATLVTGQGLFCAFHIDESHPSGRVTAARLTKLMRQRGVLAYSVANRVRIAPPLVIAEKDLFAGVDILERSLNDLVDLGEI